MFVIRALDGVLPSVYALKKEADLDEELRLLYVALTRAEENLFVVYPVLEHRRGWGDYFSNPSRFLADVRASGIARATEHPHIVSWRAAFSGFGAKPSKYPSSAEALITRSGTAITGELNDSAHIPG